MANAPIIRYTNKDFSSIREDFIKYAKTYYPDTYKDFNKASFGSLLIDLVSIIGDQLSFYVDYNTNEVLFNSAIEYKNVEKIARSLGYKKLLTPVSQGEAVFYINVPATSGVPNLDYVPVLERGSTFLSTTNVNFTLVDDIFFSDPLTEIEVSEVNSSGTPTYFAMKQRGSVISGQEYIQQEAVTSHQKFLRIPIRNKYVTEIISITDTLGNEYYQVDYLSQNIIFVPIRNTSSNELDTPYKLVQKHVPRRFIIEKDEDNIYIVFGNGSVDKITDPYKVLLNYTARDYVSDSSFDPSNIMESDKLGITPINTTLTIRYRANDTNTVNIPIEGLNKVKNRKFRFPTLDLNSSTKANVIASLVVDNEEQILGDVTEPTVDEIKMRSKDNFATQNRAVTKEDYIALCYRMDSKFGSIKRANLAQDKKSFKRNLNIYVVSENRNNNLTLANSDLKNNLKTWLSHYKMINDNIDILDAKIINFGIEYSVISMPNQNPYKVLSDCNTALTEMLYKNKFNIGQPIVITEIFKKLNSVNSVSDTTKVLIKIKNSSGYNFSAFEVNEYLSADGRILTCDEDMIFEVLYPDVDFKGTIM